jgi:cation transport ATPase
MKIATFAIGGKHCAACAVRNERTLVKIPGVLKANVNLGASSSTKVRSRKPLCAAR